MQKNKRNIKEFGAFAGFINVFFGKEIRDKQSGFTLIEVLVVVLIIGILTSIALPQYQRSVYKARFAQAKITVSALADAMEAYYPAHMKYTPVLDGLDVSIDVISWPKNCTQESGACTYSTSWGWCILDAGGRVYCKINGAELAYYVFLENNTYHTGQKFCFAWHVTDPNAWEYKFCQRETGSSTPDTSWAGSNSGFRY